MATAIYSDALFRVQLRQSWKSTSWTTVSYLRPIKISKATTPGVSKCTLTYQYGDIKREDADAFADAPELANARHWICRVQARNRAATDEDDSYSTLFYGWIKQESISLHEYRSKATGSQQLVVHGIESMLARTPNWQTLALHSTGVNIDIDRPMIMNRRFRVGLTTHGNRSNHTRPSPVDPTQQIYSFSDEGAEWTGLDIIRYALFTNPAPSDAKFAITGAIDHLNKHIPRHLSVFGRTPAEVLGIVADRKRGLGWTVRVIEDDEDPAKDVAQIYIYATFPDAITIGLETIAPSADKVDVDLDSPITVGTLVRPPIINIDGLNEYDYVIVRGAQTKAMFTLSYVEGTLEKNWTDTEQQAYVDASDDERKEDDHNFVFSEHRVPRSWQWLVKDRDAGLVKMVINELDQFGVPLTTGYDSVGFDHRFLRDLLIQDTRLIEGGVPQFRQAFALIKGVDESGEERYYYTDALPGHLSTRIDLRVHDNDLVITARGYPLPHVMARGHESPDDLESDGTLHFDYEELVVTVACETDQALLLWHPIGNASGRPSGRILHINVPDAELWRIVPGTIIGLNKDGECQCFHPGSDSKSYVRNDQQRLLKIMTMAVSWYQTARASVEFEVEGIALTWSVGELMSVTSRATSRVPLSSLISNIVFDCESQTTQVSGGFQPPKFADLF